MRLLAYAAAVFGGAAALAGSPFAVNHGNVDVQLLSRAIADERDHVTAVEVAGWIKDRRADLRVVDVRTAEEFNAYHVPTAERIPIDSIGMSTLRPREVIVLYSEGGAHAAQAWVLLRALGYENVYFLRGGLYEWVEQIMSPSLATDATLKDSADFARNMAVSRYFGGVARTSSVVPDPIFSIPKQTAGAASGSGAVARIRRRGC